MGNTTRAEVAEAIVEICPTCGKPDTNGKPTKKQMRAARNLLDPTITTQSQALIRAGYSRNSVLGNAKQIVSGKGMTVAIEKVRRRSLDKATRLSHFADSLLKNANFEGAFSDPREALQAWAIAKKVEQEERKLAGDTDQGLSEDDRTASHQIQRRRMWRVLRWAAANPARAEALAERIAGASW